MFNNIYILIPVYNEEKRIRVVIEELKKNFSNILIVNDGSIDSSLDIIKELDVKYINHLVNLGAGAALQSGFKFIKNLNIIDALITFDADGQHSVDDAIAFAEEITECTEDIIFGSRFLEHSKNIPYFKRLILSIVTFLTNLICKVNLTDSHNGLVAYKTRCLKDISISIDGFGYASQVVSNVSNKGIKYKEMSTNISYTKYSIKKGQKISNGFLILEDLIKNRYIK